MRQWVGFPDGMLVEGLIGVNIPGLVLGRVWDICVLSSFSLSRQLELLETM